MENRYMLSSKKFRICVSVSYHIVSDTCTPIHHFVQPKVWVCTFLAGDEKDFKLWTCKEIFLIKSSGE